MTSVAVTSRSFSNHPLLREALGKKYSNIKFNDSGSTLKDDALIQFLQDQDMAIVGLEKMNADVLQKLPKLKVISRFGVGLDTIDLKSMQQLGKKLAHTPGANKRAVSELVIGLAIAMLRQLPFANSEVKRGRFKQIKGKQLSDCVFGIIGLGAIGKDLVTLLQPFHCKIVAFDMISHTTFCDQHGVIQTTLNELLKCSDIVSLHVPISSETYHLLDATRLALMKPSAMLINTARGGLIDERELKNMLMTKRLSAAAFDVFESEPPTDHELLILPNFFATPHIAGTTEESILAIGLAAIDGLEKAVIPII